MTIIRSFLSLSIFLALSAKVAAASFTGEYRVSQITLDATKYAGCLVRLVPTDAAWLDPNAAFAGCGAEFVSLGCDGSLGTSKTSASLMLSSAQLAYVADKKIVVRFVDSTKTPEGYCLAERLDVR